MKDNLKNSVKKLHHKYSHHSRVEILSRLVSQIVEQLFSNQSKAEYKLLDIGCGDMRLSNLVSEYARNEKLELKVHGIDIFEPDEKYSEQLRENYKKFDGKNIPFSDNEFDVCLIADVLHHDYKNINYLLDEATRVSEYIIIKDHLEYGLYSRTVLQLMDIVGNWGYGVEIPKQYFTNKSFQEIISQNGLVEVKRIDKIELYNHLPFVSTISKSDLQFISVLRKK